MNVLRTACLIGLCVALVGCTTDIKPEIARTGIGDFSLDRVVVVVDEPMLGVGSRKLDNQSIKNIVGNAFEQNFGRFSGENKYSIGLKVQAYVLAQPGVPIVLAPKSVLAVSVNFYDGVPKRINAETKNISVFEDAGGDAVFGSGYSQTAEEQLFELAENAAVEVERWLRENEQWMNGSASRPENTPSLREEIREELYISETDS